MHLLFVTLPLLHCGHHADTTKNSPIHLWPLMYENVNIYILDFLPWDHGSFYLCTKKTDPLYWRTFYPFTPGQLSYPDNAPAVARVSGEA